MKEISPCSLQAEAILRMLGRGLRIARVRRIVFALLLGCNGSVAETSGFSSSPTSSAPASASGGYASSSSTSGEGPTTSSSTSGSSSAGASTYDLRLDMAVPDAGDVGPAGCKGKIDFVFSISANGTMAPKQERLMEAFPGFIAAIEDQLPDFDVHILVANPSQGWKLEDCGDCTTDCDSLGDPPYCGATVTACDKRLGAGVTFPAGEGASNRRCELADGRRYLTSADQPDLSAAFGCMAQVGFAGGWLTTSAVLEAISPELCSPGGCNEGFLRDDALLVVTIINDGYDQSPGPIAWWVKKLREAKHDDDDAFMVLVLTTDVDVGYGQLCWPDQYNQTPNKLRLLVEDVKHGSIGSICEKSFVPFFSEGIADIVSLCEDFVIPR